MPGGDRRISEPSTVVLVQFSELQPSQCAYPKPKHPIWGDRQTIRLRACDIKNESIRPGGEWSSERSQIEWMSS